jgi:2-polyprenyl-3-methyl-5-hydroxy-6-metoxy-1,4-benzoquinol methylase
MFLAKASSDVGCGGGFLAGALSEKHRVTACDMIVSEKARRGYPDINFRRENMQRLSGLATDD